MNRNVGLPRLLAEDFAERRSLLNIACYRRDAQHLRFWMLQQVRQSHCIINVAANICVKEDRNCFLHCARLPKPHSRSPASEDTIEA